jgi:hypothetical protein
VLIQMFLDGGCNSGLKFPVFLLAPEGGSYLVFALGLESKECLTWCALQKKDGMWTCSVLTVGSLIAV